MSLLWGRSPVPTRTSRMGLRPDLRTESVGVRGTWPPPPGHTYLPGLGQSADGRVAEAKHDRKEGIEVLLFLEAVSRKTGDSQGKQPQPRSPTSRQHPGLGPTQTQAGQASTAFAGTGTGCGGEAEAPGDRGMADLATY